MKLNQLNFAVRLGLGFGLVLMLACLIVVTGWHRLNTNRVNIDATELANQRAADALRWQGLTQLNVNRTLAIAKSGGLDDVKSHFAPMIKVTSAQISDIQKRLEAGISNEAEKAMFEDIAAKRKLYVSSRDAIFALLEIDDPGAKEALTSRLLPAADSYISAINQFEDEQHKLSEERDKASREAISMGQWTMIVLGSACLVLGIFSAWLITRSITHPLQVVMTLMDKIAAGDLTESANSSDGNDEVSKLLSSLYMMQGSLRTIVGDVRLATDSIAVASTEVAVGSQDLSNRTEQAASALEQTASSMEEMSGTIKQTADAASTANQLADSASKAAVEGGAVVSRVMSTMSAITESSQRIADIIGVIDGIAFQTNILALNAAVEAARAGEQGRGFAVVAGEVRSLAHRVTEAAKEVKTLISASVDQVQTGSSLVKDAGQSMEQIIATVQRVADIIGEITVAAKEQSDGIAQVNNAVSHLDQMTQQNAALVEQSAASAEGMKDQAAKLTTVVSIFKLNS
jgi:methyl-accepting chemotaxis protein